MLNFILHLLSVYRYIIIVPVAVVESNGTSLVVGFLGRLGLVDVFAAAALVAGTNLVGDVVLYWLGLYKGESFVKRFGKYLGITDPLILKVEEIFRERHTSILLISKLTNGLGLAAVVLFTAGMMKVPFGRYMVLNIIGECVWTAILVAVGFFFGHFYITVDNLLGRLSLIGFILIVFFLAFRARAYVRNKFDL